MTDLTQRYGSRKSRRSVLIVIASVVLTALGAWAVWMIVEASTPEVHSDLSRFRLVDEHQIDATVTVVRDRTDRVASCHARALAHDHAVVGQEIFTVDSGAERQTFDLAIRTERKATSVEWLGCTTENQSQRK